MLNEVDFSEADLSASIFDECNMERALFHQTNLEKADFRTSYSYMIDPEQNRLKRAKFSILGVEGLLAKHDILISK